MERFCWERIKYNKTFCLIHLTLTKRILILALVRSSLCYVGILTSLHMIKKGSVLMVHCVSVWYLEFHSDQKISDWMLSIRSNRTEICFWLFSLKTTTYKYISNFYLFYGFSWTGLVITILKCELFLWKQFVNQFLNTSLNSIMKYASSRIWVLT